MNFDTNGQVGDVLENYVKRIEKLSEEKNEEYERYCLVIGSIDRLSEALSRLEYQKRRERAMAKKIARAYSYLERGSEAEEEGIPSTKSLTETIHGVLNGAKATGQIIEIVANSIQVMMETVVSVVKNQSFGNRSQTQGESKGLDLVSLLKPVNAILSSLVSKQQPPEQPETKAPDPRVEAKAVPPVNKDEGSSVMIVKAVPLDNVNLREKT